jgi:hypothetical protein
VTESNGVSPLLGAEFQLLYGGTLFNPPNPRPRLAQIRLPATEPRVLSPITNSFFPCFAASARTRSDIGGAKGLAAGLFAHVFSS